MKAKAGTFWAASVNAFGILELGVDLLMGSPHAKFIYISINKVTQRSHCSSLRSPNLRSKVHHNLRISSCAKHPTREWRIFRPKLRASKKSAPNREVWLTAYRKKSQIWDHLVFKHKFRLNWQMILSRSLLVKEQKRKVGSGCDWNRKGPC